MKKRHIVFLLAALVLFVTMLLPPLVSRISYEHRHTGYVTALDLNDTATAFGNDRGAFYSALLAYKNSGVTTAVLRETEDGSFDSRLLELSSLAGLDTALAVYDGNEKSLTYEKNLRNIFAQYSIKYLLLKSAPTTQKLLVKTAATFDFAKYIEAHQSVLVLCENLTQVSNEMPPCFESCLAAANGRVLRAYETLKAPGGGEDRVFHQMMNSARDRNTEFLLIHQRTDMGETPAENAAATQNAVRSFCAWMQRAGYTPGLAGTLDGYTANLRLIHAAGTALMLLMAIFMLYMLVGKSIAWAEWGLFALSGIAFATVYIFQPFFVAVYPMLFAPFGACFSFSVAFYAAQKLKDKPVYHACCGTIAAALGSLLFCCAALASILSGADYYLNIRIFHGVSLTLILPVLYALLLMLCRALQTGFSIGTLKADALRIAKRFRWYHALLLIAGVLILALYLLRSGNSNISYLETQIRNLLGEWTMARPRTKEVLIGWPLLVLFVLSIKRNQPAAVQWLLAAGSSILFASVMNTFCHVFTDATTSALRTLYGLLFAVPFMFLYVWLVQLAPRLVKRLRKATVKTDK